MEAQLIFVNKNKKRKTCILPICDNTTGTKLKQTW